MTIVEKTLRIPAVDIYSAREFVWKIYDFAGNPIARNKHSSRQNSNRENVGRPRRRRRHRRRRRAHTYTYTLIYTQYGRSTRGRRDATGTRSAVRRARVSSVGPPPTLGLDRFVRTGRTRFARTPPTRTDRRRSRCENRSTRQVNSSHVYIYMYVYIFVALCVFERIGKKTVFLIYDRRMHVPGETCLSP